MEKMNGESMNLLNENIEKLKALFPEIVTDGKIDFDMLKTLLGEEVDASNEKYSFNWVGKRNCIKFAQTPSTGTLIPCKEKSVDFDNTQNIYIEGDNVEALKLLQKTYFGKIKMIYIDPPYNTGNDFVYHDDYKDSIENYKKITGQQATANPETNGRFHTDWLNMMYPRLKLAKDLLSDDGVILVNMDENEIVNLQKTCMEIFGENNDLGTIVWDKRNPKGDSRGVSQQHEYIVLYAKNKENFFKQCGMLRPKAYAEAMIKKARCLFKKKSVSYTLKDINEDFQKWLSQQTGLSGGERAYCRIDDNGDLYQAVSMAWPNKKKAPDDYFSPLVHPATKKECPVPPMGWRNPKSTMQELLEKNLILFGQDETTQPRRKYLLKDNMYENIPSLLYNGGSDKELLDELGIPFDTPKMVSIVASHIQSFTRKNDIILDFFSGSATTAHAVMQLNAEDGGNRKFIMVQLPELCDEKSEAYKAGYKTICDIGEERIRRAGAKIKEENPLTTLNLDTGFKVFRLDSTNIVPWNNAEKLDEMRLYDYAKTIKDGRDDLSVAYEIMLKYGVFDKPMKEAVVSGKKMYDVGEGYMIICLADGVTMTDVEAIARLNPHCVVFKESGFADDNEKINATHTLERGGVEKILCI